MKKFLTTMVLVVWWISAANADLIDGFWGVSFGTDFPHATMIMAQHKAVPVFDSFDYHLGRTALWTADFYGRHCFVQMWFGEKGLWRVQISFQNQDQRQHFKDLEQMLSLKYGQPLKSKDFSEGTVRSWKKMTKTLFLTFTPHTGTSKYDTVLTYNDRARMPK